MGWFIGGELGQHAHEVPFILRGDNHVPIAILNVAFGEKDGALVVRRGGNCIDQAREYVAKFGQGV